MKILLIGLDYHRYIPAIADELRALGHDVTVHDIIKRTLGMKALRVIWPKLQLRATDAHHRRILTAESGTAYDWVLFIQCHWVSHDNMKAFKAAFPHARFSLYNWDSIATHDYRPYRNYFADIFTFDSCDAAELGLRYLPLFCIRDFQDLRKLPSDQPAVYVVGNIINPQRYIAIDAFRGYCERHGVRLRAFMAIRLAMLVKLLRQVRRPRGLSFRSIDDDAFHDMIECSIAAFDFANHQQAGHTMRVIENLCAGKKIITNNARVLDEHFYSPDRFHVYRGLDFSGVRAFLELPLAEPEATFPEYHVQAFARHLIEGTGHPLPGASPARATRAVRA